MTNTGRTETPRRGRNALTCIVHNTRQSKSVDSSMIAMTRATIITLVSVLCFVSTEASGQSSMGSHEEFVCNSGTERKIVAIYNFPEVEGARPVRSACRVDYTKDRKTRTLWRSSSDHAFCTRKALALVTKLIQDNYTCAPSSVGDGSTRDDEQSR
jgi:hypothetical protein